MLPRLAQSLCKVCSQTDLKVRRLPRTFRTDERATLHARHVNGADPAQQDAGLCWYRPYWVPAVVFFSFLALAVICYWHAWTTNITQVSFQLGDQFLNMWYLTWTPFALLHGHNPFFSTFVNYPHGANLLTNTGEPLLGLLASPITLIWGPVASFNVMMTLAMALSAFAGYVFVAHWVRWRPAAIVGGLVYGFSPYEIAQGAGHLNLTFVPLPPLILLCAYRIVVEQEKSPIRSGIALGLLITAQFFISSEVLADTAIIGLIGLILIVIAGHKNVAAHARKAAVGLGIAGGLSAVLLAYPIWFALAGPGSITGPIQRAPQHFRADLLGPVVPTIFQAIAPASLLRTSGGFGGNPVENGSYLGILLLLLLGGATVVLWRRTEVRICALLGMAAFILSLGDRLVVSRPSGMNLGGHLLPGWILFHLPLYSNAVPVRFSLYVALFAALLLGLSLDAAHFWLQDATTASRLTAVAAPLALGAVALIPLVPAVPYGEMGNVSAPGFYTDGLDRIVGAGQAIVTYPYADSSTATPMLWQAQSFMHFRMPGGNLLVPSEPSGREAYSTALGSALPTTVGNVFARLATGAPPPRSSALKQAVDRELAAGRFSAVVATPRYGADPAQATAYLVWLFGRPSTIDQGTLAWKI